MTCSIFKMSQRRKWARQVCWLSHHYTSQSVYLFDIVEEIQYIYSHSAATVSFLFYQRTFQAIKIIDITLYSPAAILMYRQYIHKNHSIWFKVPSSSFYLLPCFFFIYLFICVFNGIRTMLLVAVVCRLQHFI